MAPLARLPFSYNAQRALYDTTYATHKNYWDLAVAPDLKIIHYSGAPKPWVSAPPRGNLKSDGTASATSKTGDYLTDLWRQSYQKSKNFVARYHKDKEREAAWKANDAMRQKQTELQQAPDPKKIHQMVAKRYKALRREGMGVKEAMAQARAELGLNSQEEDDQAAVGAQVASMFGVML